MEYNENFFDELNSGVDVAEAQRQTEEANARAEKLDYLIHRVFQQNEDGQELLSIWKETLIMSVGADEGMDLVGIGIKEGYKRMIRNIILTIKRVEGS